MPYTDTYISVKGVPIVNAATAWTCMESGQTYIFVFHEGLWMGDLMHNSLINPNQLRAFGCIVQDNPFSELPIYLEDPEGVIAIALTPVGTNILSTKRTPSQQELDNCPHIVLTLQQWESSSIKFPKAKWIITEERASQMTGNVTVTQQQLFCNASLDKVFNIDGFSQRLN